MINIDVDTFKWILGGMAAAIGVMGVYIGRLHHKINSMYADRVRSLEEQLRMLELLRIAQPGSGTSRGGGEK